MTRAEILRVAHKALYQREHSLRLKGKKRSALESQEMQEFNEARHAICEAFPAEYREIVGISRDEGQDMAS